MLCMLMAGISLMLTACPPPADPPDEEPEPIPAELVGSWYSVLLPEDYILEFTSEHICNFTGTGIYNATGMNVEVSGNTLSLTATISGQSVPMVSFDYSISGDELSISNASGTLASTFTSIAPFKKGPYVALPWDGETVRQLNDQVWSSAQTAEYIDDDTYTWYKFTPTASYNGNEIEAGIIKVDGIYYIHADVTAGGLAEPIVYTADGNEVSPEMTETGTYNGATGYVIWKNWPSGISNINYVAYSLTYNTTYYIALRPDGNHYSSATFTVSANMNIGPPGSTYINTGYWRSEATIEYVSDDYYTWYSFNTDRTGTYYIQANVTTGGLVPPRIFEDYGQLTSLDNDWTTGLGNKSVSYNLTAGKAYFIALRPSGSSSATFTLALTAPLQEEDMSSATTLTLGTWSEEKTIEWVDSYTYTWYSFTPSSTDRYYIHADITEGDILSPRVYTADGFWQQGSSEHWGGEIGPGQKYTYLDLTADTTYYFALQPIGSNYSENTFTLAVNQWSYAPFQQEDDMGSVTTLTLGTRSNEATIEYDDAIAWYKFTSDNSGTYYIHSNVTDGGLEFPQVYTAGGSTIGIDSSSRWYYTGQGYGAYSLTADTTYYIALLPYGDYSSATFTITMNQSIVPPDVTELMLNTWSEEATTEYDDGYTWYKFTPSSSGTYYIHADFTVGALDQPTVYTDVGTVDYQSNLGWHDNQRYVSYSLTGETTYYIRLQPYTPDGFATFTLAVNQSETPPAE
ncbi:MAG: hypothetical protein LBM77_10710 [Spirochaetaceae bacterium]|nr:hypothetical protein [Spirochaetaceae bacterium]